MFAISVPGMATRMLTSFNSLLIPYAIGCCQFRLKTLHFCIYSMEQRVFCFDDGIFGLEEGVLQMQFNVFRLKSGVSGLYLCFEIHVLVSRLHPLNGGQAKLSRLRNPFCGLLLAFHLTLSIGPSPTPTPTPSSSFSRQLLSSPSSLPSFSTLLQRLAT